MRRLLAIAAGLAGLACWGQAASGVALIDVDGDGFAFRRLRDAGATPDAGLIVAPAFFAFAPAFRSSAYDAGQGLGAECACADVTTPDGGALTFTRATTAYCTKSDYTLVSCAVDKPRIMPGRPGAPLGIFIEQSGQNDVLRNRDLSNAAWTKTNATCLKDATGPDGVGNSASTCTSTSTNATVTQAVTRASGGNSTSLHIKRVTGTGVVSVTRDNSTFAAITSDLTTDWKRVVCLDTDGCMGGRCIIVPDLCATSANPTVGVKLATSGDAVAIDFFQNEAAANGELKPTSPMATTGSVGTRTFDLALLTMPAPASAVSSWSLMSSATHIANSSAYTMFASGGGDYLAIRSAVAAPTNQSEINATCVSSFGGALKGFSTGSARWMPGGPSGWGCSQTATTSAACMGGLCYPVTGETNNTMALASLGITIGGINGFGSDYNWSGVLSDVCLDTGTACRRSAVMPTSARHIAWIGDSLSAGIISDPIHPVTLLYSNHSQYQSRGVGHYAIGGGNATLCRSNWDGVKTGNYGALVMLCGVNSLKAGATATAIWSDLGTVLNEAYALGWHVVPITVAPWGHYPGTGASDDWTLAKQTETDALNALILGWCASHSGSNCVDAFNSLLRVQDGGYDLDDNFNSGDKLHWNSDGGIYFTAFVVDGGSP